MTSPSETPLDLDAIRAGIDMLTKEACYTPLLDEWALEMKRNLYRLVGDVERLRELESRPRTVGDLTARDLGRRMRIGDEFNGPLDPALFGAIWMFDLDTPVEFLDDEPANDHQQPGERLPSHEQIPAEIPGHEWESPRPIVAATTESIRRARPLFGGKPDEGGLR